MSEDLYARRLYPRLRVFKNGDAEVNACRAGICTTVVSTAASLNALDKKALQPLSLAQAQESIQGLDTSMLAADRSRLPDAVGMSGSPPPNEAYVNVFIDVLPDSDGEPGADSPPPRGMESIESLEQQLKQESIRGTVIRRGNMISATIPITTLNKLEKENRVSFVNGADALKLDVPAPSAATRPRSRSISKRALHRDGEDVMIGIIDVGGFDFAHPDFLDRDGKTRFTAIWDQGGDFRASPARFNYGTEFQKQHLDRAIEQSAEFGFPATELERQSQQSPGSHGTHVASIAAGNRGVCPKAEIAAVLIDIPTAADERERRQFTFSDSSRIAHAVEYLLDIAQQRKKPISINISLGTNGGAHDGSNAISRWLDHSLSIPGRAICAAAGNAGQEAATSDTDIGFALGRIHTSGQIRSRGLEVELEWTVVGNGIADLSENELEIWYSPQDRFIVSVQPPGDDRWYTVGPQQYRENQRLADGTHLSIYNELYHPNNGANYVAVYLSPNLDANHLRGVSAGVWKVRLRGDEIRDGRFHAWIERDDPVEIGRVDGERFFRFPSFFTSRSNVDSHSISSLACGHAIIGVANADHLRGRINITSSQGPTRDGRSKPEIAAPGTDIVAANGFQLDGEEWISMTGTSMASPYVTGVIGLMLAANKELCAAQCMGILQRTAQPLPGQPFEWQTDSGFGTIDPEAAINEATSFTQRKSLT